MEKSFIISCGSTVDMPFSYVNGRGIPVIFYSYTVDGNVYKDDMIRDPGALPRFYAMLAQGKLPSTSQLNTFEYEEFFGELIKTGDVLHIAFGSGMTPSVKNAEQAAATVQAQHPERRLVVIDSLCSSSGYGMLVDYAADMRDAGCSMDEVIDWVMANRGKVHHQFFSTDLKYFRRGGRISGTAATIGAILNICPIMHLDAAGKIIAYDKVRGKRNAIERTVDTMEKHAEGGREYSKRCYISHSNSIEDAERTRAALEQRFPALTGNIRIFDIGTIIASHTGPGTVAVFFMGDERV